MNLSKSSVLPIIAFSMATLGLSACSQQEVCSTFDPVEIDTRGAEYRYVVSSIEIPDTTQRASEIVFDFDGDGFGDNQVGQLLGAIQSISDYNLSEEANRLVAFGEVLQLLHIQSTSLETAEGVGVQVALGLDLDDDPSDNFRGDEIFAIDPNVAPGIISGSIEDGRLLVHLGEAPLAITFPGLGRPIILHLTAATIRANITENGLVGTIGGAISMEEVHDSLIPAFQEGLQRAIDSDCPQQICGIDSFGEKLQGIFDTDMNYDLSVEEIETNSLTTAVLGPAMDLYTSDSTDFSPNCDGVKESISLVVGFTAVRAGPSSQ